MRLLSAALASHEVLHGVILILKSSTDDFGLIVSRLRKRGGWRLRCG
jgi:hypothetical protein